jgi:hypothetical protein
MVTGTETKELQAELQVIYEKHLPKQVGETLQKRLELADKLEKENSDLIKTNKTQYEEIQNLKGIIEKHKTIDEREEAVTKREVDVTEKENKSEIEKLKYQLESEKDKTQFSKAVALGLVRNIEYRKNVFDTEMSPGTSYYDSVGNYHTIPPIGNTKDLKETNTAD